MEATVRIAAVARINPSYSPGSARQYAFSPSTWLIGSTRVYPQVTKILRTM